MSRKINRRDITKTTALGGAASAMIPHSLFSSPVVNNNINLGFNENSFTRIRKPAIDNEYFGKLLTDHHSV